MRKLLRACALFAAIAGLAAATGLSAAPGQKDKDVKKDDKAKVDPKDVKKVDPKAEEAGVVELYMAKDGWRYRIKNAEGKSVAVSVVGFEKKEDAVRALEMAKVTLTKGKVVELKDEKAKAPEKN